MKGASAFDEPVQVWNCDFTQSVVLCFSREAENKSSGSTFCSSWKNTVENTGLAKCGNPPYAHSQLWKGRESSHFILTVVKEILSWSASRSTASQIINTRAEREFKDLPVRMSALNSHFAWPVRAAEPGQAELLLQEPQQWQKTPGTHGRIIIKRDLLTKAFCPGPKISHMGSWRKILTSF